MNYWHHNEIRADRAEAIGIIGSAEDAICPRCGANISMERDVRALSGMRAVRLVELIWDAFSALEREVDWLKHIHKRLRVHPRTNVLKLLEDEIRRRAESDERRKEGSR